MKKTVITALVVLLAIVTTAVLASRGNTGKTSNDAKNHIQYNMCILLDLSDRIDPHRHPLQAEKDKKVIAATIEQFCDIVKSNLYINSTDTVRVAVAPQPNDYGKTLLNVSDSLSIDMRKLKVNEKREKLPLLKEQLLTQASLLYESAVKNSKYEGGDIWSFFRDNLEIYRVESSGGREVRNILVVLTDGYISFDSTKDRPREARRTSWMEVARMRQEGWLAKLDSPQFGLLLAGKDHHEWEVLVLEVDPQTPQDLPIINKYWSKWLTEMGINHFSIQKEMDSSKLTKDVIAGFIKEQQPKIAKVANTEVGGR